MDLKSQRSSIWWTRRTSQERFAKAGGSCLLSGSRTGVKPEMFGQTQNFFGALGIWIYCRCTFGIKILEPMGLLEAGEHCCTQASDQKAWKHRWKSLAERLLIFEAVDSTFLNRLSQHQPTSSGKAAIRRPLLLHDARRRKSYICPWYFPSMSWNEWILTVFRRCDASTVCTKQCKECPTPEATRWLLPGSIMTKCRVNSYQNTAPWIQSYTSRRSKRTSNGAHLRLPRFLAGHALVAKLKNSFIMWRRSQALLPRRGWENIADGLQHLYTKWKSNIYIYIYNNKM